MTWFLLFVVAWLVAGFLFAWSLQGDYGPSVPDAFVVLVLILLGPIPWLFIAGVLLVVLWREIGK